MDFWLFNKKCKLGYWCDASVNHLIPFGSVRPGTTEIDRDLGLSVSTLTDKKISLWDKLGSFLNESFLKCIDHHIVHDQKEYYTITCFVTTKCEQYFGNPPELRPQKTSKFFNQFVSAIDHGMIVHLVIPKKGMPNTELETKNLLSGVLHGQRRFSDAAAVLPCRILVNCNSLHQMSLLKACMLIRKFKQGLLRDMECAILAAAGQINPEHGVIILNEEYFGNFLTHLYACYRKIEMKMDEAGYPIEKADSEQEQIEGDVNAVAKCRNQSLVKTCYRLETAKIEFKNMERNNFLQMYPVIKNLFLKYQDYLKIVINNRMDIEEGEDVPGDLQEIGSWLRKLNNWTPVKIGNLWCDPEVPVLIAPSGFERTIDRVKKTFELASIQVASDDSLGEPHLFVPGCVTGPFGFADMSGAVKKETKTCPILDFSYPHSAACPAGCTDDVRKWICSACGSCIRINSVESLSMNCHCGSKPLDEQFLHCVSHNHRHSLVGPVEEYPRKTIKRGRYSCSSSVSGNDDEYDMIPSPAFSEKSTSSEQSNSSQLSSNWVDMKDLVL